MKVLWFTNTPSLYKKSEKGYNGGGWIESLQESLADVDDLKLAVSFYHEDEVFKVEDNTTTYYPIALYRTYTQKILHTLSHKKSEQREIEYYLRVVKDFQPDIIHIFGSERSFGLISGLIEVPVIIHIQGILNPYLNAYFAPGTNLLDYLLHKNLYDYVKKIRSLNFFKLNAKREKKILSNCKYFMGRTNWDYQVSKLYSPNSEYFFCGEILRKAFYKSPPWTNKVNETFNIVTTISQTDYKGFDLVLKTAQLLTTLTKLQFTWNVIGIKEYSFWEHKLNIRSKDVNVKFVGIVTASQLISNMLRANIYIHPSYIDNSPNSLCEAQMLGLPIIATNVGGVSSLIEDQKTGLLVPANDPYALASMIIHIHQDPILATQLGHLARTVAQSRHEAKLILNQNITSYKKIINKDHVA